VNVLGQCGRSPVRVIMVVAGLLLFASLLLLPARECYYKAVDDATPVWPLTDACVQRSFRFSRPPASEPFLFQDGRLFLLVYEVETVPLFLAILDRREFLTNVEDLRRLAEDAPQLDTHWPDSEKSNLGVRWVPESGGGTDARETGGT